MSRPGWFDELPESMSEAEYHELPEDVARTIEVVYGHVIKCESPAPRHNVIKCESPAPRHNRIARRLSFALESARSPAGPCLTVETDVDVVLWRVPRFTFRRADVVVYECIGIAVDKAGGGFTMHYTTVVVTAARTGLAA